jgi:hypothetical protein
MGEIKSTLDLIMEKTKNLSMSAAEKEEIKQQEWIKKARGWIRKFLDEVVDLDKIKGELLEKEQPAGWKNLLKKELIEGLEPEGKNHKRIQLLNELLGIPSGPFEDILEVYHQHLNQVKAEKLTLRQKELAAQGIFGSAVIPNLNRDPSWAAFLEQEKQSCRENWRALISN